MSISNKKPHPGVHPKSEFKSGHEPWNKGISYDELYTEQQRKEKFSRRDDFIWITDGTIEEQVSPQEPIKDGFRKGRLPMSPEAAEALSKKQKALGIKPPHQYGYVYYTNGETTVKVYPGDNIPDGFRKGRTMSTQKLKEKSFILSEKFQSIDINEYIEYFKTHSRKETMEFFGISINNHKALCKYYSITKKELKDAS